MIDQFDFCRQEEQDLNRINNDKYEVFLIHSNRTPIGYLTIQDGQPPHLLSLYLLPEYQRQGAGRMAFARMADFCKARNKPFFLCQCQPENTPALTFYRCMGGIIIARDEDNEVPYMNSVTLRFDIHKEENMRKIAALTDMDVLGTPGLSNAKTCLPQRKEPI